MLSSFLVGFVCVFLCSPQENCSHPLDWSSCLTFVCFVLKHSVSVPIGANDTIQVPLDWKQSVLNDNINFLLHQMQDK